MKSIATICSRNLLRSYGLLNSRGSVSYLSTTKKESGQKAAGKVKESTENVAKPKESAAKVVKGKESEKVEKDDKPKATPESKAAPEKKKPIKIVLNEKDLEEKFVKGSGPGGQSVNKTNNCVQLTHKPTGISVTSHEQRELKSNRKSARKKLIEKLDILYNGADSKAAKKIAKEQKKKAKSKR